MELNRSDVEKGILRLENITLSADTTLEEMEKLYLAAPQYFSHRHVAYIFGFSGFVSAGGVTMRVYAIFQKDGSLSQIDLSPVKEKKRNGYFEAVELQEDYALSCQFLQALIGCTAKNYDWGTIETYLFPDYHDSYHGGNVYISYHR